MHIPLQTNIFAPYNSKVQLYWVKSSSFYPNKQVNNKQNHIAPHLVPVLVPVLELIYPLLHKKIIKAKLGISLFRCLLFSSVHYPRQLNYITVRTTHGMNSVSHRIETVHLVCLAIFKQSPPVLIGFCKAQFFR